MRTLDVPALYKSVFRKAYGGKSKAAALKAKCLDCCCMQRIEVENCTVTSCPIHSYRPYQKGKEDENPPQDEGVQEKINLPPTQLSTLSK